MKNLANKQKLEEFKVIYNYFIDNLDNVESLPLAIEGIKEKANHMNINLHRNDICLIIDSATTLEGMGEFAMQTYEISIGERSEFNPEGGNQ
jgi:hypothetical protein